MAHKSSNGEIAVETYLIENRYTYVKEYDMIIAAAVQKYYDDIKK